MYNRYRFLWILFAFVLLWTRCASLNEGRRAFASQDYAQTLVLCRQALAENPANAEAYHLMGDAYIGLDSLKQAEKALAKSRELNPSPRLNRSFVSLYIAQSRSSSFSNSPAEALAYLLKAESLDSLNQDVLAGLGEEYSKMGMLRRAETKYMKLLSLSKDTTLASGKLEIIRKNCVQADTYYRQGMDLLPKNLTSARDRLEKAVKINQDHLDALYQYQIVQGRIWIRKGTTASLWDAIELFGKASMIRPKSAEPHYYMALAYDKKDPDEYVHAIDELEIGLELEPEGPFSKEMREKRISLKAKKEKMDRFWQKK